MAETNTKQIWSSIGVGLMIGLAILFMKSGLAPQLFQGNVGAPPSLELPSFGPTIVSRTPASGATNVSTSAGNVTVVFEEAGLSVDAAQDITLKKQGSNSDLSTAFSYNEGTKTLTIPYNALEQSATYTVFIPKETVKNEGDSLESDETWSFSTGNAVVVNGPTIASKTPASGATNVSTSAGNATLVFNEANLTVDAAQDITVKKQGSNTDLSTAAFSYNSGSKTLTIPYGQLENNKTYTITVPKDTIKNNGVALANNESWSFTTKSSVAPPSNDDDDDDDDDDDENPKPPEGGNSNIKITDHDVYPVGFNPLVAETKITYEISAKAKIELKIIDHAGVNVVTLIDNQEIEKGDYFIFWDGTNKKEGNGQVVEPGTYYYKVIAKDPENDQLADSKTGSINVIYQKVGGTTDFEDGQQQSGVPTNNAPVNNNTTPVTTTSESTATNAQNAQATVALQNSATGVNPGTGPGVLIYALLPAAAYLLRRKNAGKHE